MMGLKRGEILFSASTLRELQEVLWRKKFDQYLTVEERKEFITNFVLHGTPVEPVEKITECRDPKDNKFLELAVSGNADFIISGDEDLLVLNPFRDIPILTPHEFIETCQK